MKNNQELQLSLEKTLEAVKVGNLYYHYKHPEKQYKIIALAFFESTEEPCVVYEALYESGFSWIRPVSNFLEKIEKEGKVISRFTRVE